MPPIIALLLLFLGFGVVMAIIQALDMAVTWINNFIASIGGWNTVWTIAAAVVVLTVVFRYLHIQDRKRRKVRALPNEVDELLRSAADGYDRARAHLQEAVDELAAERSSLFWDQMQECHTATDSCTNALLRAGAGIEWYNQDAPRYGLKEPPALGAIPARAAEDVIGLLEDITTLTNEALAKPAFAMVYEQRRAAAAILDMQAQAHADVQADLQRILASSERTAEAAAAAAVEARRARRTAKAAKEASKRAAGDWF